MKLLSRPFTFVIVLSVGCLLFNWLASVRGQDPRRHEQDVSALIQQLKSDSLVDRLDATEQLGSLGPYASGAVSALTEALATGDSAFRYEVVVALQHIGPFATAAAPDVAALLSSDIASLRVAALDTLRRIGSGSDSVIAEVKRLTDDPNTAVAVAAMRCAIALNGEDNSEMSARLPMLVDSLSHERSSVRNAAADSLVAVGAPTVPLLKEPLKRGYFGARLKACEIARRLGPTAAELVPALIERLHDENELIVRSAATALGSIRSDADLILPELGRLLKNDSAALQATVLLAIMEFGPQAEMLTVSVRGLANSQQSIVRSAAARALGQIGKADPQTVQTLVDLLADPHGGVTIRAANSLAQLGSQAVSALTPLLDDVSYRRLIVTVLGEIGPDAKSAVPALVNLLQSEDAGLRRETFIALASIGPEAKVAVPALLRILRGPDAGPTRAGAAYVLANIGEQSCMPDLLGILNESQDTNDIVSRAAAWAVVTLQPQNEQQAAIALPYLVGALSSEDSLARRESLLAIGKIAAVAQPAADHLLQLGQDDPDAAVRAEALHTLALLPEISDAALPVAVAALDDDDLNLRNAARFLLGKLGPRAVVAMPALKQGVREGAEIERIVCAWALVRVHPCDEHHRQALPLMLNAIRHPDARVRVEAAETLGQIGISNADVTAALKTAADDADKQVSFAAKSALKQIR